MTDVSHDAYLARMAIAEAASLIQAAVTRPSVLYRPTLTTDGARWCALFGDNLQVGVAGFGDTPADAMAAFDTAFTSERTPTARLLSTLGVDHD